MHVSAVGNHPRASAGLHLGGAPQSAFASGMLSPLTLRIIVEGLGVPTQWTRVRFQQIQQEEGLRGGDTRVVHHHFRVKFRG